MRSVHCFLSLVFTVWYENECVGLCTGFALLCVHLGYFLPSVFCLLARRFVKCRAFYAHKKRTPKESKTHTDLLGLIIFAEPPVGYFLPSINIPPQCLCAVFFQPYLFSIRSIPSQLAQVLRQHTWALRPFFPRTNCIFMTAPVFVHPSRPISKPAVHHFSLI